MARPTSLIMLILPFEVKPDHNNDPEYKDVLKLAAEDLNELQRKKLEYFGERFNQSVIYKDIVYLGASAGRNSLSAALKFFKGKKGQLKNVAINISAHGNPYVIGTERSESINPYELSEKFAEYVVPYFDKKTNFSIYLRSCNSAYIEASEKDEAERQAIKQTFAGKFSESISTQRANKDRSITVSGYKGFLGVNHNNKLSVSQLYTPEGSQENIKTVGADRSRFVYTKEVDSVEIAVTLPENYNIKILGVCLPAIFNDISQSQDFTIDGNEFIESLAKDLDSHQNKSQDSIFLLTLLITVKLICERVAEFKQQDHQDHFVSQIQSETKNDESLARS
ncbi:MAG: hypothetical protein HOM96_04950 [Rickettsiales bacterium]|jgi:hypothetical protein|nr:hypothetical protein [Rickettsiales bacterium]